MKKFNNFFISFFRIQKYLIQYCMPGEPYIESSCTISYSRETLIFVEGANYAYL